MVESLLPPPNSPSDDEPLPVKELDFTLNFGESQLPQEWKDSITKKLREMPEVFSQHDLDFGHTQKVKHRIQLK